MNARIRIKRKKQAYIEGLERGNQYLKGALQRQGLRMGAELKAAEAEVTLTRMLLYAAVIQAGGSVAIETKGLKEMLGKKEIDLRADAEGHMVHIEVKDKEQDQV